jgi:hypothetical protein
MNENIGGLSDSLRFSSIKRVDVIKLVSYTHYMDKNLYLFNNLSMFYACLIDVKKVHDDDIGKIRTCRSFVGLCVKIYKLNL